MFIKSYKIWLFASQKWGSTGGIWAHDDLSISKISATALNKNDELIVTHLLQSGPTRS